MGAGDEAEQLVHALPLARVQREGQLALARKVLALGLSGVGVLCHEFLRARSVPAALVELGGKQPQGAWAIGLGVAQRIKQQLAALGLLKQRICHPALLAQAQQPVEGKAQQRGRLCKREDARERALAARGVAQLQADEVDFPELRAQLKLGVCRGAQADDELELSLDLFVALLLDA